MKNKKQNVTCIGIYLKTGDYYFLFKEKKSSNILCHKIGSNKIRSLSVKKVKQIFKKVKLKNNNTLKIELNNKKIYLVNHTCQNPPYYIYQIEKNKIEKNCENCDFFAYCICYSKLI